MKKSLLFIIILSLTLPAACNQKEVVGDSEKSNRSHNNSKFIYDSIKISDSTKINEHTSASYSSTLLFLPTLEDKSLLDSIYIDHPGLTHFSKDSIRSYILKSQQKYYDSIKVQTTNFRIEGNPSRKWYYNYRMKLLGKTNRFLQLQYYKSSYSGGAHGNYSYREKIIDLNNKTIVRLRDITSMPEKRLQDLLLKNLDTYESDASDSVGKIKNSDLLLVEEIPLTENFYFDHHNIYFHYSPYEIAAYAAGDIIIPISWEDLKPTIEPYFLERIGLK